MSARLKNLAKTLKEISSRLDKGATEEELRGIAQKNSDLEFDAFLNRQYENGAIRKKVVNGRELLLDTDS